MGKGKNKHEDDKVRQYNNHGFIHMHFSINLQSYDWKENYLILVGSLNRFWWQNLKFQCIAMHAKEVLPKPFPKSKVPSFLGLIF